MNEPCLGKVCIHAMRAHLHMSRECLVIVADEVRRWNMLISFICDLDTSKHTAKIEIRRGTIGTVSLCSCVSIEDLSRSLTSQNAASGLQRRS